MKNLSGGLFAKAAVLRRRSLEFKTISGRKCLRGGAERPLKFPTEMGLAAELQFRRSRFVGITPRYQILCQAALQFTKPLTWCAIEITPENAL